MMTRLGPRRGVGAVLTRAKAREDWVPPCPEYWVTRAFSFQPRWAGDMRLRDGIGSIRYGLTLRCLCPSCVNTRAKVPGYLAQRRTSIWLLLASYHHAPERLSRT